MVRRRILVADDEHLIAASISSNLTSLGHEVLGPVSNGHQAIEMARNGKPELALLDIRMPEMGGLEAARAIWTEQQIPVVIISAYSDERDVSEATDIGVFGYLVKPVDLDNLRVAIAVAMSRAGAAIDQARRVSQLERNMANRRLVEEAKWRIVEKHKLPEPDAHTLLQRYARNARMSLSDVAKGVVEGQIDITQTR